MSIRCRHTNRDGESLASGGPYSSGGAEIGVQCSLSAAPAAVGGCVVVAPALHSILAADPRPTCTEQTVTLTPCRPFRPAHSLTRDIQYVRFVDPS